MNVSIGENKAFGGATPCYKWLEDYHNCRGMTGGIRAVDPGIERVSCWMIEA